MKSQAKSQKIVRSTTHFLSETNTQKHSLLKEFIRVYRETAKEILDQIWDNGYSWTTTTSAGVEIFHEFNPRKDLFEHPKFIEHKKFNVDDSRLSARSLSSLVTQLAGIIGGSVEKQRKRLYILNKFLKEGKIPSKKLLKKIKENVPKKPNLDRMNIEFSTNCCDWEFNENYKTFQGFLRLKSIGSEFGHIKLPIKFHRLNKKYLDWSMKTSFLIGENFVNIRWEKDKPKERTVGKIIGADQGLKTVLTLSDEQTTTKDIHGHDLDSILDKLVRKKKGSRAFRKASQHRTNHINWSIKQLDLSNIKEIRLEEVVNIGYKNPRNRKLSHWTNTIIRDKVEDLCELNGVRYVLQDSTYKSQRCCECGLVRKSNRKSKEYSCECGNIIDADLNSSKNHEQNLPDIPFELRKLKLNLKGFYWTSEGFFDLNGVELRVPLVPSIRH